MGDCKLNKKIENNPAPSLSGEKFLSFRNQIGSLIEHFKKNRIKPSDGATSKNV